MVKKGGTVSGKLFTREQLLFSVFFVYRTLNTNKVKYKNFLHEFFLSPLLYHQSITDYKHT